MHEGPSASFGSKGLNSHFFALVLSRTHWRWTSAPPKRQWLKPVSANGWLIFVHTPAVTAGVTCKTQMSMDTNTADSHVAIL
jgi:hypothetical protein